MPPLAITVRFDIAPHLGAVTLHLDLAAPPTKFFKTQTLSVRGKGAKTVTFTIPDGASPHQ